MERDLPLLTGVVANAHRYFSIPGVPAHPLLIAQQKHAYCSARRCTQDSRQDAHRSGRFRLAETRSGRKLSASHNPNRRIAQLKIDAFDEAQRIAVNIAKLPEL
jgi:hypothetical protein